MSYARASERAEARRRVAKCEREGEIVRKMKTIFPSNQHSANGESSTTTTTSFRVYFFAFSLFTDICRIEHPRAQSCTNFQWHDVRGLSARRGKHFCQLTAMIFRRNFSKEIFTFLFLHGFSEGKNKRSHAAAETFLLARKQRKTQIPRLKSKALHAAHANFLEFRFF